jgi:hypothetical protein
MSLNGAGDMSCTSLDPAVDVNKHAPTHIVVSQRRAERIDSQDMQKWVVVKEKLNYRNKTT